MQTWRSGGPSAVGSLAAAGRGWLEAGVETTGRAEAAAAAEEEVPSPGEVAAVEGMTSRAGRAQIKTSLRLKGSFRQASRTAQRRAAARSSSKQFQRGRPRILRVVGVRPKVSPGETDSQQFTAMTVLVAWRVDEAKN